MKIRMMCLLFLMGWGTTFGTLWAETAPPPVPPQISYAKQAHQLLREGKYVEAKKIYETVLAGTNLKPGLRKKILGQYENLNLKLLFSRFETAESFFYTVVEGDNLSKIAKDNHTTVALIKRSNGLASDTIRLGMTLKITKGVFSIRVDKSKNVLTLWLDDKPLKHFKVATGAKNGTPAGKFRITTKIENPTWYRAGAVVPPGSPENGLGTRWLGFDYPGYGIHGTIDPGSIGKQATLGCVRMLNEEVEKLYDIVPVGTVVTITD